MFPSGRGNLEKLTVGSSGITSALFPTGPVGGRSLSLPDGAKPLKINS
jgi:hypothetical protein